MKISSITFLIFYLLHLPRTNFKQMFSQILCSKFPLKISTERARTILQYNLEWFY